MPKRKKKKKYRLKPIPILLLVIILLTPTLLLLLPTDNNDLIETSSTQNQKPETSSTVSDDLITQTSSQTNSSQDVFETNSSVPEVSDVANELKDKSPIENKNDWNLKLINRDNPVKENIEIQKTKFDSQYIDSRIAANYEKMYLDAKKDGIILFLRSGYRTISTQKTNYEASIENYVKNGNSRENAIKLTDEYYAKPGHSEHHTGLALDIITPEYHNEIYTLTDEFAKTDAYKWLKSNAYKYGFILRYPEDKTTITGFNFEPWHYRYIGEEAAKYVFEKNLCLEEYLKL